MFGWPNLAGFCAAFGCHCTEGLAAPENPPGLPCRTSLSCQDLLLLLLDPLSKLAHLTLSFLRPFLTPQGQHLFDMGWHSERRAGAQGITGTVAQEIGLTSIGSTSLLPGQVSEVCRGSHSATYLFSEYALWASSTQDVGNDASTGAFCSDMLAEGCASKCATFLFSGMKR